jgi:hypothetical protein
MENVILHHVLIMLAFDFLTFFLVFALFGGLKGSMQVYSIISITLLHFQSNLEGFFRHCWQMSTKWTGASILVSLFFCHRWNRFRIEQTARRPGFISMLQDQYSSKRTGHEWSDPFSTSLRLIVTRHHRHSFNGATARNGEFAIYLCFLRIFFSPFNLLPFPHSGVSHLILDSCVSDYMIVALSSSRFPDHLDL